MVLFRWFSGLKIPVLFFCFYTILSYAPHLYTTIIGVCTCIVGSAQCSGCMVYDPINSAIDLNIIIILIPECT